MITQLVVLATAVALALSAKNWRYGIFAVIVIGVLQDPMRKLTPGVPSYYLLWAAAIFAFVAMRAFSRIQVRPFFVLSLYDRRLFLVWRLFVALILLQAAHALVRWGSPQLPMLGLMFYFAPVAALLVGFYFARDERWIRRFMLGYVLVVGPSALTIYFSVEYSDAWPVLRDIGTFVGKEMRIYDVGTVLQSHPGIFRVGEIAGWHAATSAVMAFILFSRDPRLGVKVLVGLLIVALIGAIILTGRRKMLGTLTVFIGLQLFLMAWYRRGAVKQAFLLLVLGVAGMAGLSLFESGDQESLYLQRGTSVFDAAEDRITSAADLMYWAVVRGQGIGLGAGAVAQGAQHVGGVASAAGGSGEAGVGKIVIELGLPGLVLFTWLVIRVAIAFQRGLKILARVNEQLLYYAAGLISFFGANAVTFFVAAQVYGDLFVLIILGLLAGMLFSIINAGMRFYRSQLTQSTSKAGSFAGTDQRQSIPST